MQKTKIEFSNKNGIDNEIVVVPNFILKYWKLLMISILIVSIGSLILMHQMLRYNHSSLVQNLQIKYQSQLEHSKASLDELEDKVNLEELKSAFASIDQHIGIMNNYLAKRGISVGYNNKPNLDNLEEGNINLYAAYYKQYAAKLNENISSIPLGIPTEGAITSRFGNRNNPFSGQGSESHKGLDFKGPMGQNIKVTANGRVKMASVMGGYGNCVIVQHRNGYETLYGHLSKINVKPGQEVKSGDNIGNLGSTGRSTGPHLHYEVMKNGEKINPESFLSL